MRAAALSLALTAIGAAPAAAQRGYVGAGLGFPSLAHVEAGWLPIARLAVEVRGDWVIFNPMVGAGVTGYLLGDADGDRPPRHALLLSGRLMVNPTLGELTIEGDGAETIGALAGVDVGYGWLTDAGFHLRPRLGVWAYEDDGFAVGGHLTVTAGWVF